MYTHIFLFFFTITLSKCDYFVDPALVAEYEAREGKLAKDDMLLSSEERLTLDHQQSIETITIQKEGGQVEEQLLEKEVK